MGTMKIVLLFIFAGLASASFQQSLDDVSDELLGDFLEGLEKVSIVRHHLGEELEDDAKTELGKNLKEGLNRVLEKIKEAVKEGKVVKKEFLDKVKELLQKLRDIKDEAGDRGKELLREIKEKARGYLRKLLEKYGLDKRSTHQEVQRAIGELDYRDMLRKLKEHLKKTVDPELLKEKIEKIFGQASKYLDWLLKVLKEKGRRKLEILIDAILDEDDDDEEVGGDRQSRGFKDYWEKVKDYFKGLKIDIQEKYARFGEWVKDVTNKGWESSKDRMENIKAIASEFLRQVKTVSDEVRSEAKGFFGQYKKELGIIWEELKEKIDDIKNKKE